MLDPRREAFLIADKQNGELIDKTSSIVRYDVRVGRIDVLFDGNPRVFSHGPNRVTLLRHPAPVDLADGVRVEVRGAIWESVTEVWIFTGPEGSWSRVFYTRGRPAEEVYLTYPAEQVRLIPNVRRTAGVADVLDYWREIVDRLDGEDPLRRAYDRMGAIHPESVLARYLAGAPIEPRGPALPPIFPFRCNLSQQDAVDNALGQSISIIEGPPGTGKTETILNLVANIVVAGDRSVGVVSSNNAAVINVREKFDESVFGYVIADLGKRDKRDEFLARQDSRNAQVAAAKGSAHRAPSPRQIADLAGRLRELQRSERDRAVYRAELDAYELELRHFDGHVRRQELPDLERLPLLRRSADRILDYLAETELERAGARPTVIARIRQYFRYGSLRGVDATDTDVVLRLQRAYYEKRIATLTGRIEQLADVLQRADIVSMAEEYRRLSVDALCACLNGRYRDMARSHYDSTVFRQGSAFPRFLRDYPVLLSTCHALPSCVPNGHLLDYIVIDEASQAGVLVAALAMSRCRNLVVVGDLRQLGQIKSDAAEGLEPPGPAYDCRNQNVLTSLVELYPEITRIVLREHYRCDPAIIGFCNKAFYDGALVPYTIAGAEQPMVVAPTVAGNHMRQHRDGGRSNQREVDVIINEVIPTYCPGVAAADIGITTPYRRQVDKVADSLIEQIDADTVHSYQGRQRAVIILTTVLDETWRGRAGLKFADDPQLINVAVSRAARRFILVTNNDMLPTSRHIRDLVDYIRYQNPGQEIVESAVISVFDLLYRDYSQRLQPLAARLKNEMVYKSEDIIWTVLQSILVEEQYAHLVAGCQVLVRNLLSGVDGLTTIQRAYVHNRASVDFVVYNRVSNLPRLAIEVDGFKYHEDNPAQLARDALKNDILEARGLRLLRLATTGSDEETRIRRALDEVEESAATEPAM